MVKHERNGIIFTVNGDRRVNDRDFAIAIVTIPFTAVGADLL